MPIYKIEGKKDGLQKYRVRVNYIDKQTGKYKQTDRIAYGKEQAKELEQQLIHDFANNNITTKKTVSALYDEYVKARKNEIRESTMQKHILTFNKFIIPELGNIRIDRLTPQMLRQWKTNIDNITEYSVGYKREIYAKFRTVLNYAVKMEYIPKNPLNNVGNFKDTDFTTKEPDYYTADEFRRYIAIARENATEKEHLKNSISEWQFYVFFNIAFYTGMRKGEIAALKWADISNNAISITKSISYNVGNKITPPKNKSSIRTIQIPEPLKNVLEEHYARCKSINSFTDGWFICGNGTQCISATNCQKHNAQYAEQAGLKRIRIHDFRHSHASLLANAGINIQEIARRLGHSNVEITWNTYSHLYPREEERAITVLNQV